MIFPSAERPFPTFTWSLLHCLALRDWTLARFSLLLGVSCLLTRRLSMCPAGLADSIFLVLRSRISFFYFQPSILPPPGIPKLFDGSGEHVFQEIGNLTVTGSDFHETLRQIPRVPGALTVNCWLSESFHRMMEHDRTRSPKPDSRQHDMNAKQEFYTKLRQFRAGLPERFLLEHNRNPTTSLLRCDKHPNLPPQLPNGSH